MFAGPYALETELLDKGELGQEVVQYHGETLFEIRIVKCRRVVEIGPRSAATPDRYPAAVPRLEFPGCTICPSLCDGHMHLTFSTGAAPLDDILRDSDGAQLLRAAANARAALQAGVTTLRDLGARGRTIHEMRDAIDKDIVPGPRILSSGAPITCLGGHIWNLENSRIWW